MANNHQQKHQTKSWTGYVLIVLSISTIIYSNFEKSLTYEWYVWAFVASVLMCAGLSFLSSSVVHKIKADFIKKQKVKENRRTMADDH